jgi:hypothetical protein
MKLINSNPKEHDGMSGHGKPVLLTQFQAMGETMFCEDRLMACRYEMEI